MDSSSPSSPTLGAAAVGSGPTPIALGSAAVLRVGSGPSTTLITLGLAAVGSGPTPITLGSAAVLGWVPTAMLGPAP